jgi:hypothetical protein
MVAVRFKLKNNPDVIFEISSDVIFVPFPSLLERTSKANLLQRFFGKLKIIFSGKRVITGMPGEEIAATLPAEDKSGPVHTFSWETLGELRNPLKPNIQFDIESGYDASGSGGAIASSLDTKQLRQLYEAIVKTIRLRPVGEASQQPISDP